MNEQSIQQHAWNAVADVEGWMTRGQSDALSEAAQHCPPGGTVVEIGSFRGRSTVVLAMSAPADATIYAIDPHAGNDRGPQEIDGFEAEADDDHDMFTRNLAAAGIAERVTHLRTYSDDALADVDGDIDVLYVDGAHRYGPALADIRQWGRRVRPAGTLLIHDSFSSIGVTLAILHHLAWSSEFRYVRRSRSLAVYKRVGTVSRADQVANLARQVAQLPWFAKNVAVKVALTAGAGKLMKHPPEWPY